MNKLIKKVSGSALACSWLLLTASHSAWAIDISDKPLVMEYDPIPPNVMFMIDDSGSMRGTDQFYTPGYDFFAEDYTCASGATVISPSAGTVNAYIHRDTDTAVFRFGSSSTNYVLSETSGTYTIQQAVREYTCSSNTDRTMNCRNSRFTAPDSCTSWEYWSDPYRGSYGFEYGSYSCHNNQRVVQVPLTSSTVLTAADCKAELDGNASSAVTGCSFSAAANLPIWNTSGSDRWVKPRNLTFSERLVPEVTATKACFDPERTYTVKLEADSCSGDWCSPSGSVSTQQYDGGFLNWYFSASSTDYFDYNAGASYDPTGGLSKDLSGPDTNFNEGSGYKQNTSGSEKRMDVAKDIAHLLVKGIDNMIVGIASFQSDHSGGEINQELVELDDPSTEISTDDSYSNREDLQDAINGLRDENWTPLAETWATLMHYFSYSADGSTNSLDMWTEDTKERPNRTTGESGAYTLYGRTCTGGGSCRAGFGVRIGENSSFTRSQILEPMPSRPSAEPITSEFWCRNNYIIGLTDGEPTNDGNLRSALYYNESTAYGYFNGDLDYASDSSNGTDALDDVAVFMYEQDMRPDIERTDNRRHNVTTYMIAFGTLSERETRVMESAAVYSGGKFYNAKSGADVAAAMVEILGSLENATYAESSVALTSGSTELGGNFAFQPSYSTGSWTGSLKAFPLTTGGKFQDSSGTVVASSAQADYDWDAGEVLTNTYAGDAGVGGNYKADAASGGRYIYTQGSAGKPIEFTSTNIGKFVTAIENDLAAFVSARYPSRTAIELVEYLRGKTTLDGSKNAEDDVAYRDRNTSGSGSILGDIVHSTPVYVQAPPRPWLDSSDFGNSDYSDFQDDLEDRMPVVYVGANDGMLHAFKATDSSDTATTYTDHGDELFAYIPSFIASANDNEGLHYYAEGDYDHYYYVDATPVATDVYVDFDAARSGGAPSREWHTLLLGGAGKGGKGIYALNITCPVVDDPRVNEVNGASRSGANKDIATRCASSNDSGIRATLNSTDANKVILWEFDSTDDTNLGYTYSKPIVGKIAYDRGIAGASDPNGNNNGSKWVTVLGNGYNSTNGYASLFVLMIDGGTDGTWTVGKDYIRIDVDKTGNNGLSVPTLVDIDGDLIYDYAYAGDLKGNVWRFTFDETASSSNYTSKVTATKIFQARDSDGNAQPITTQLQVARDPDTKANDPNVMVVFGTGKALGTSDINDNSVQTLYGVHDRGQTSAETRATLKPRTLTEVTTNAGTGREIDGDDVDYSTDYGWYIDLVVGSSKEGERVVFDPLLAGSTVFYSISKFTELDCDGPTDGVLAALDWRQGMPGSPPFDFDQDGDIDSADFDTYNADSMGMLEFDTSKAIVYDPENKLIYGNDGNTETISADFLTTSQSIRLSWKELFPLGL